MVAAGQSFASAKKNDPEKSEILLTTSPCRSRYVSRYARENTLIAVLMMCPEGSFTNAGSPAMPITDDPELSPLAILAVNTLREAYHRRGPHAFNEAALILFMAVGSITVGDDGHFIGFEPMICDDDAEAIEKAKRLVHGHDVELWCGDRLVIRLKPK